MGPFLDGYRRWRKAKEVPIRKAASFREFPQWRFPEVTRPARAIPRGWEGVTAGLVAGDDGGVGGEAEAGLGLVDLGEEDIGVAGGDGAEAGLLAEADGEGELPGVPTQLQGEVELGGASRVGLPGVGR